MPDNNPCTCPVVWAFAPQAATITPGCPLHHEQRLENATYTAVEMNVLTEAALRLGRTEAAEEIALVIEAYHGDPTCSCDDCNSLADLARLAREIGTKEAS